MTGRILVADSIATNRIVLKVKLAAACYEVHQAATGRAALQQARSLRPAMILFALDFPDLSGEAFCKRVRADPLLADVPLVALASEEHEDVKLATMESGADDVLMKPLDETVLLSRIRSLLRAHEVTKELRARNRTLHEMGFAEPAQDLARPGRACLVGRDTVRAKALAGELDRLTPHQVSHADRKTVMAGLFGPGATRHTDVFVMNFDGADHAPHRAALVELRLLAQSRHAEIIARVDSLNSNAAAMALDLGASDVVPKSASHRELALRISKQIARKQRCDQHRAALNDGLRQAVLDPLTGLYNRRYAERHLARLGQSAERAQRGVALMMVDIDRFKRVNDRFGHAAGDSVLRQIADRLRSQFRSVDMVCRFGGEEFLIAQPEASLASARQSAERLRAAIAVAPFVLPDGASLTVTVSVGLAIGSGHQLDIEQLISQADRALYASKSDGRNAVTVSRPAA